MINEDALLLSESLIKRFEGLYLRPYLCPAGVPTIGYGSTRYIDGRTATLLDPPIDRATAEKILRHQVRTVFLPGVMRLCPTVDDPYEMAVLIDFSYNLGLGRLRSSTLRRRVNDGEWRLVPQELRKWVRGGGRILKGLVLRREAEIALIS